MSPKSPFSQGSMPRFLLFDPVDEISSNSLLIQQAREDAQNMHKGSRMEKMKRHARKLSVNLGNPGEGINFEGDLHL